MRGFLRAGTVAFSWRGRSIRSRARIAGNGLEGVYDQHDKPTDCCTRAHPHADMRMNQPQIELHTYTGPYVIE